MTLHAPATSHADLRVTVSGRPFDLRGPATARDIFAQAGVGGPEIMLAALNNRLVGLDTLVHGDADVRPIRADSPEALTALRQTVSVMFHAMTTELFPALELSVGQAMLGGYFYDVSPAPNDLDSLAATLTARLEQLARDDLPFLRYNLALESAGRVLTDRHGHKRALLNGWPKPTVPVVKLNGFADIQHAPIASSTRFGAGARVLAYGPGLVLVFPGATGAQRPTASSRLYQTFRDTRDWNRRVGIATVGDLNASAIKGGIDEVIRIAEAQHEKRLATLADAVAQHVPERRAVSVAGPSSSGKTTFVRRLSIQLRVNGITPVVLSLDHYYRNREDCPRDADGNYDFEALEALNLELIHDHLDALLRGEAVRTPRFDFALGKRLDDAGPTIQLGPKQVLLIEGIHGLNPGLLGNADSQAFKIYINALQQLVIDEHNRLLTADARLLRRIVRDRRYRATSAADTLTRWPSVRRGEEKHIFPFEGHANAVFNSALVYEPAVLKTFAWRYLLEVPNDHPTRTEAYRLLKFFDLFVPVFPDAVPATSVLREFIGGSGFSY